MEQEAIDKDDAKNRNKKISDETIDQNKQSKHSENIKKTTTNSQKRNTLTGIDNSLLTIGLITALGIIFLLYFVFGTHKNLKNLQLNDEKFISKFNKHKNDYSMKLNSYFQGMSLEEVTNTFKSSYNDKILEPKCNSLDLQQVIVPENYNFYDQHPECRFNSIQQKGATGYVDIPTGVFRSRFCVLNLGKDFEPSPQYILECDTKNEGIKGGQLNHTLDFIKKHGFISQQCWFSLKREDNKCPTNHELKKCEKYEVDSYCSLSNSTNIKKEIFKHGPVISVMEPYQNLLLYEKGIYNFDKGRKLEGKVFIKIIGWGKDSVGTEYWLVESSWGKEWGEGGLAKVRMNVSGSSLDNLAIAIYPKIAEIKSEIQ